MYQAEGAWTQQNSFTLGCVSWNFTNLDVQPLLYVSQTQRSRGCELYLFFCSSIIIKSWQTWLLKQTLKGHTWTTLDFLIRQWKQLCLVSPRKRLNADSVKIWTECQAPQKHLKRKQYWKSHRSRRKSEYDRYVVACCHLLEPNGNACVQSEGKNLLHPFPAPIPPHTLTNHPELWHIMSYLKRQDQAKIQ